MPQDATGTYAALHQNTTFSRCSNVSMTHNVVLRKDAQCTTKVHFVPTGTALHSKVMSACFNKVDEQLLCDDGTIETESIRRASTQVLHHRSRQFTCMQSRRGAFYRAYPDAICIKVWAGVDMPILTDTIPSVLLHSSTASRQMRLQEHMYP